MKAHDFVLRIQVMKTGGYTVLVTKVILKMFQKVVEQRAFSKADDMHLFIGDITKRIEEGKL